MTKILLVSKSPSVRNALNYLFTVILKFDFECIDFDACEDWLHNSESVNAIFVDMTEANSNPAPLISTLTTHAQPGVVLAIQELKGVWGADAFEAGAIDVLTWPCNLRELSLRLNRRLPTPTPSVEQPHDVSWDVEAYIALRAGLTTAEAQIMRVLFAQDGQIVTRDALSLAVESRPWRYGDRKFDVHVAKIRKKFADTFDERISVETVRSSGYMLRTGGLNAFDPT